MATRPSARRAPLRLPARVQAVRLLGRRVGRERAGPDRRTNSVQSIVDGCVVLENWKGAAAARARASLLRLFLAQVASGLWAAAARAGFSRGEYTNGQMRYAGETRGPNGARVMQRLTSLTSLGSRAPPLEQSRDAGKTWRSSSTGSTPGKNRARPDAETLTRVSRVGGADGNRVTKKRPRADSGARPCFDYTNPRA